MLEVGTKLRVTSDDNGMGLSPGIYTVWGFKAYEHCREEDHYQVSDERGVSGYGILPKWIEEGLVEVVKDTYTSEGVVELTNWYGDRCYIIDNVSEAPVKTTPNQPRLNLNHLCQNIHQENVQAGWWNDINTGEDMRSNTYFQTSKLLLVHSELSEATEALRKGLMDDKLPQYPGEAVELVDALIRIFDYCGLKGYDVDEILKAKTEFNSQRKDHKVENRGKQGGKLF